MKFADLRRNDSHKLVLIFSITSLITILLMRLYLKIMNNPQISFGVWHIAHVLWGGVFMLVGIMILGLYVGQQSCRWGMVVSGIGWGLFVDEIGKFISRDNNYWFQPAIMIIYISFILLFLYYKKLLKKPFKTSDKAYWIVSLLEKSISQTLTFDDKKRLQKLLKNFQTKNLPVYKPKNHPVLIFLARVFNRFPSKKFVRKILNFSLVSYLIYFSISTLIDFYKIFSSPQKIQAIFSIYRNYSFSSRSDPYLLIGLLLFETITSIVFAFGLYWYLKKKIPRSLKYLRTGLMIQIFISSVLKFYFEQLSAIIDCFFNLAVLWWIGILRHK